MKLVIYRDSWLRGEGEENSKLLRSSDNKLSCSGFFCLACGVSRQDITDKSSIREVHRYDLLPAWFVVTGYHYLRTAIKTIKTHQVAETKISHDLRVINNNINTSDQSKEASIISLFKTHEIDVEFIDGLEP